MRIALILFFVFLSNPAWADVPPGKCDAFGLGASFWVILATFGLIQLRQKVK